MSRNQQSGFTITELSLAMTMLSILLVIILLSVINITTIYNKGVTLKRANQSGAAIGLELQSSLRRSSLGNVQAVQKQLSPTVSTYTRLCTGVYSFIWSVRGDGNNAIENYSDGQEISFIKMRDSSSQQCHTTPPAIDRNDPSITVLLGDELVVRPPTNISISDNQKLITFEYTVSTPEGDDIIYDDTGRSSCQGGKADDFCALNTFKVTSYARGKGVQ